MPARSTTLVCLGFAALALTLSGCSDPVHHTASGRSSRSPTTTPSTSSTTTTPSTPSTTTVPAGSEAVYPGASWTAVAPAAAGMDPAVLDGMAKTAQDTGSNCLLVTRRGQLVAEWYWNGAGPDAPQEIFSASKSVTSTLVGMAHDDGDLQVSDPASEYIPEWKGTPSEAVTVENLLSNDSGRHFDLATDYGQMAVRAPDKTAFAVGLGQDAPPGTTWVYNNSAIQSLEEVFSNAAHDDMADFAARRLFAPVGMAHTSIHRDAAGNPLTFMGVQSTCRDMARFGYLMLRHGRWDDTQVVSEQWVNDATGHSSQKLNAAYGWLWWLNRPGPVLGAPQATGGDDAAPADHQLVPGAPEDMFFALGLGGQTVAVDPASETVVVRLGPFRAPQGTPGYRAADAAVVTKAVG